MPRRKPKEVKALSGKHIILIDDATELFDFKSLLTKAEKEITSITLKQTQTGIGAALEVRLRFDDGTHQDFDITNTDNW